MGHSEWLLSGKSRSFISICHFLLRLNDYAREGKLFDQKSAQIRSCQEKWAPRRSWRMLGTVYNVEPTHLFSGPIMIVLLSSYESLIRIFFFKQCGRASFFAISDQLESLLSHLKRRFFAPIVDVCARNWVRLVLHDTQCSIVCECHVCLVSMSAIRNYIFIPNYAKLLVRCVFTFPWLANEHMTGFYSNCPTLS